MESKWKVITKSFFVPIRVRRIRKYVIQMKVGLNSSASNNTLWNAKKLWKVI